MEFTAKQLAQVLKGTVDGDENAVITKFAKIEHGKPGTLSFFANPKYEQYVYTSEAIPARRPSSWWTRPSSPRSR